MIWNNVRASRLTRSTIPLKITIQVRHKSRAFPLSASFLPQNNQKSIQQVPRAKSGTISLDVGRPSFYQKPVIQHNVIQAAKVRALREAAPKSQSADASDVIPRAEELDPVVEDAVNKEILRDLNYFTTDAIQQYGVGIRHPDITPSIPGYLDRHKLHSESVKNMWLALQDLLPEDVINRQIESANGVISHKRFRYMKQYGKTSPPTISQMNLAWYLLMSNIPINPENLCADGTNTRFMPGNPDTWAYRLWAGGSLTQHTEEPMPLDTGQTIHKTERVTNVRLEGQERPTKAFVTIRKEFFLIDSFWPEAMYNKETILQALTGDIDHSPRNQMQYLGPFASETYTLCFLREPPDFSALSSRVVAPPTLPRFQHTFTPTRHLLFCWSALTYNAHLIHLDPEYARTVYAAPNLLVHGPLTIFMALEWFERTMTQYALDRGFAPFEVRSVEYRNLAPLYVDESMTLSTKPTRFQTPGTLADSWDVWIEKTVVVDGKERKTMAFKATVKLAVGNTLKQERYVVGESSEQEEKRLRRSGSFRSPYFGELP